MEPVLREVSAIVCEVDAPFSVTITFLASHKDDSSDDHILGEDIPVVQVETRSKGAAHDGVVLVAVVARVKVLHFQLIEIERLPNNGSSDINQVQLLNDHLPRFTDIQKQITNAYQQLRMNNA